MNCWPCFDRDEDSDSSPSKKNQSPASNQVPDSANVKTFSFRELAMATKNFRQECLLGEGGFGRVFRGMIQASGMVVAVKQLDRNGMQGNKEFTNEAVKLSLLNHANLVNLIGYCADGDQRVLVYEYVPMGSLDQHLFGDGPDTKPLDWSTRMNLASGAAQALEYLHEKANPPVIYGDLKSSNVLLNEKFEPKLSDVGLSKFGAGDGTIEQGSRMMATYGYSAPEYSKGGEVTLKSDIYSFGVVLLELITGRRAIDTSRPIDEQNLVTWAQPFFRDPKRFSEMADPRLNKEFHATSLNQAVGIAAMCIQDEPMVRPLISDVTSVLSCICMIPNVPPQPQNMKDENEMQHKTPKQQDKHSAECDSSSSSDSEDTESRDQQSGECHDSDDGSSEYDRSGQVSDRESGSDDESGDQSDEESTYNSDGGASDEYESSPGGKPQRTKTKRAKSRQQKAEMEGVPSSGSPRQTVVTFKEPSKSSRYSPGGKSQSSSSSSSSSEENSSESEDEGVSSRHQEKYSTGYSDATENGLSSSHDDDRESDSC